MTATRLITLFTLLALMFGAGGAAAQDEGPGVQGGPGVLGGPGVPALEGGGAALANASFTYQGWLQSGGVPVSATCDFQFSLFDALNAGVQQGSTQTATNVTVAGGRFTVVLNSAGQFGPRAFDGSARWLAISVRCPAGSGGYTALTPRQALTAAPLALALPGLRTELTAGAPNVVGGHISNTVGVGVEGSTIGGGGSFGVPNSATSSYVVVGGGQFNSASDFYATVGGGYGNTAGGTGATISGGTNSSASGAAATVGGGANNQASGQGATVGGGGWNGAALGGNQALGIASAVGGGFSNIASGHYASVPGGRSNTASGDYATVAGGLGNTATALYSFAAGRSANAVHEGAFVWSSSSATPISSTATNQFRVRATGGISLSTTTDGNTGCRLSSGGSTWLCLSDRNSKANFAPVDGSAVLDALMGLPIATWNFNTQDAAIRHMGPTAQDFYAAFGLGEEETTIGAVDADGVALAAIQGLYGVVQEKESLLAEQRAEIAALAARVAALEAGGVETGRRPVATEVLLLLAGAAIGAGAFALGRRRR